MVIILFIPYPSPYLNFPYFIAKSYYAKETPAHVRSHE